MRAVQEVEDVVVSTSLREASYCREGWTRQSANTSLWAFRDSTEASTNSLDRGAFGADSIAIVGRYIHSKCRLTLVNQPAAHVLFEAAVETALASQDASQRAEKLAQVFERFGHVYIYSVEMGGMKHIRSARSTETQVCLQALL